MTAPRLTEQLAPQTVGAIAFAPEPAPAAIETTAEPAALDRFFGRETERETLEQWLKESLEAQESVLITLTGMGGVGKTRLARELTQNALPVFGGRVHFISLAEVVEPARLFEAICNALQLPQTAEVVPLDHLAGVFEEQPFLLLLDNFEQIADGGDMQVQALRRRLPAMTLFLTSRQRWNVAANGNSRCHPCPLLS